MGDGQSARRQGNVAHDDESLFVREHRCDAMVAYDRLTPALRRCLAEAWFNISAVSAERVLHEHGEAVALRAIHLTDRAIAGEKT